MDADLALNSFLRTYFADCAVGGPKTISHYQRLHPGHERLIAEEHARLVTGTAPKTGRAFGRYRLVRELGRGGQGIVHLAIDGQLQRQVALKVLTGVSAFSGDVLLRFRREAEVASRIDHPGICAVYDAGEHDGMPFIAMRYVDGVTLAERIATGRDAGRPAPVDETVACIEKVARALQAAHEAGVLHRDVKPGNVMLTRDGDPVILDFGLACVLDADTLRLTRTGDSFGTPSYMSPEQVAGGTLDAGTDVYSLAATLFEALTLRRPFDEPTREKLYHAICTQRATDPKRLNPAIGKDLAIVVGCGLEPDRTRRYHSARDFAEDLRRVRAFEPIRARPVGPLARAARWARRSPALAIAVSALFTLLVVALVVTLGLLGDAHRERDSKNAALGLVERLSDVKRLEDLRAEAESLWPAEPANVPAMQSWLHRADALAHALPGHRVALSSLRERGRLEKSPDGREAWVLPSTEQQWHHDTLTALVRDLDVMTAGDAATGLVADVRERLRFAESVERLTIQDPAARWQSAIEAIAVSPRYRGLRLAPQLGLIPLQSDPRSGLHEFAHLQSGSPPARDSERNLTLDAGGAIVLVLVPGGTFRMGTNGADDPDLREDERPAHEVTLDPYFLSKYELTQAQWRRVTGNNPSPSEDTPICPLRHSTFDECERTLRRIGLDIPTEAQWEYAARAGTTTRWWTGADPRSIGGAANVADKSIGLGPTSWRIEEWLDDGHPGVAPVGCYRANAFGLHDVIGNVWEWCRDRYGKYAVPARAGDGLRGATERRQDDTRVARGGSYIYAASDARSARRSPGIATGRSIYNGVRPSRAIR